jgi:transcriptional regulator with XRE-family HTH domain
MDGKQLRVIRDLSGLTAAQMAKRLGVGVATIHRYERGDYPIPPAFARKVVRTFGISEETAAKIRWIAAEMDEVKAVINKQ